MENLWAHMLRADAKRILRDRFLLLIVTYLPLMAIGFRFAIPALAGAVQDRIDIRPYYPVVSAILTLILPYIMGCVLGLQLLEEKDERSLSAVVVTPFSLPRYFAFRSVMYAAVGTAMLLLSHLAMGIVDTIPPFALCTVAAASALNTPLSACIIAILAKNQVQGFAVLKGSGVLFVVPVLSFFLPRPWDLLCGALPFYWPVKAYYTAVAGGSLTLFWIAIALGVATQIFALAFLYRLFLRRIIEL